MSQLENEQNSTTADRPQKKPKKKYEPLEYYQENTFIDAKDSVNAWCLGRIIERCDSDSTLKINFDGWSHRWDEWFGFNSSRIAPFRKYSQGYSGQSKFAIRDWKFSVDEIKEKTQKLAQILDTKFECFKSPFELTQYIRGTEFTYVDSLLQNEYQNPISELPLVFEYFKMFFRVYIAFLNLLPEYLPDYNEGLTNLDAFLTNERVALAHCLYELSDSVNKIMGSSERLWGHFGSYDSGLFGVAICDKQTYSGKNIALTWTADKDEEEDEEAQPVKRGRKYSRTLSQLVNLFGELGGFDAWLKIFTYYKEESKDNYNLPPFKMLKLLLNNISNIYIYLNKDVAAQLMPPIKDQIARRLKYMSDKEIKDLDKDALSKFILKAQALLAHFYSKEEVFLLTETAELDIAFRFLTSNYFEKKIRGINEIKELTEKIDVYEHFNKDPSVASKYMGKMTKHLSAKMFIAWVFENKIFELILGDSMHVEIIKRTHDILKFIGKYQKIPLDLIDLLWKSCEGKHEATLMGMYDLIVEISDHLDPEGIKRLKQNIESIKDEEQNEMTLNLIKGFAHKTLPTVGLFTEKSSDKVDETKYHCLGTLWRLMLDDSKVTPALSEMALNGLTSVLKERASQPLRRLYLNKCFDNIKYKVSVCQSINLIHSILNNGFHAQKYDLEVSLGAVLQELDHKYDLIDMCIAEFENFHKKMAETTRKSNSTPNEDEKEKIYSGKYNYNINFHNRLVFLEYLITNQAYELSLNVEQAGRLWDIFVLDPIFESDRDVFFGWISRKQEMQRYSEPTLLLSREDLTDFFEKIICNHKKLDFFNINPEGFDCFVIYFKLVNELHGTFRLMRPNNRIQVLNLDFEGKNALWAMFLNCKNEVTIPHIISTLVECHLKLSPGLENKKQEVWENFTMKCVNLLKEGSIKQNDRLISKAVMVLMHFFDKFEGKNRLHEKSQEPTRSHSTVASIIMRPENTNKNIIIGVNQPIEVLRKKIGEAFRLDVSEFKLFARGNPIERDEDDTLFSQLSFNGPFVIHKIQASTTQKEEYHPKRILAENSEYVDLLFKLLSEDIQAVNDVWDLLMRLPLNEKIKNSLYEINDSWENLLDIKSTHLHRLLYCLQIIEGFLLDNESERREPIDLTDQNVQAPFKDQDWADRFFQTGGLKTLLQILMKPEFEAIKSPITIKTLSIILKIVCYYFCESTFDSLYSDNADQIELAIMRRVISLLHSVCEHSLIREQKETEAERNSQPLIKAMVNSQAVKIPENHYYEGELLYYTQSLFLVTIQRNPSLLKEIYEYPSLEKLLSAGLIQSDNQFLKEKFSHGILSLLVQFQKAKIDPKPHQFFLPILLQKTLEVALTHQDRSITFFNRITNILNNIDIGQVNLDVDGLIARLVSFVKERKPNERHHKETDAVLHGILQVLRVIFQRYPEKTAKYGQDEKLVSELLQSCLFEIPRRTDKKMIPGPKCKSHETRQAAYKLLIELSKGNGKNLREIVNFILPMHKGGKWRTKRYVDWNITPKETEKSSTGYVGLKNLACICYMNSTIQQLYMIPSFRKFILAVEDKEYTTTPKQDNLLHQLKCIFVALNESEKQYYNPKGFCHSFKDWDGNPTNVYEQMDADEFFNMFMDKLENSTKGTKYDKGIKQHFGGVLSNELICKGCPHYSEREEPFINVSLQVKNKKSIYQSLSAFVEGEMLEGDNAYFCTTCQKKVNTLKRVCLKKLPNHLMLVLKRFEFDFDTMQKVKVNDYCEFPTKLNIEPYTQQGLRKAEKAKKGEKSDAQEQPTTPEKEYPESYFEYKLTGVVIHLGIADAGHYYSLIQDRELTDIPEDKRWYEFNDTLVSRFDPKDIPSEAYGGEEKWRYYSGSDHMMSSFKEKIKNAYLLFYERIAPHEEEEETKPEVPLKKEESKDEKDDGPSTSKGKKENTITEPQSQEIMVETIEDDIDKNIPEEFLKQVIEKNQIFHQLKYVFGTEYFEFVTDLFIQRDFTPNLKYNEGFNIDHVAHPKEFEDLLMLKVGIVFLLTSVIRDRSRKRIVNFLPALKKQLAQNVPACLWLLEMFSAKRIQLEFLLDCPVGDMRRFVVGLLSVAIKTVYQHEGKGSMNRLFETEEKNGTPTTYLANFINCSINLIFEAKHSSREYTEFFKVFSEFAQCGPETAGFLITKRVIGRFMDFFFENVSPLNEFFRDMSDARYREPAELEIGYPQDEKFKVRAAWEEMLLKRKERALIESHMASKAFMWKTISILIKYCRMNPSIERPEWQIGDEDYEVLSNEKTLLVPESKFIEKVIGDAGGKMGYRSLADMYSYLSYEDQRFTNIFVDAIKNGLHEGDCSNFRAYFRCLMIVLTLKDSFAEYRCKELCNCLVNLLNENKQYFLEMDALTSFILKIVGKLDNVRDWFLNNAESWNWVVSWLTQHQIPPLGMVTSSIKLQKKRISMGMSLKYDLHEYKARSTIKMNKFKRILVGEILDLKNAWDSDDDLADREFKVGDKLDLDVHGNGKWTTGEVDVVLEEMINLNYIDGDKDQQSTWQALDSEQLAPHRAMLAIQEEMNAEAEKYINKEKQQDKGGQDTDHEGYNQMDSNNSNNSDLSEELYEEEC